LINEGHRGGDLALVVAKICSYIIQSVELRLLSLLHGKGVPSLRRWMVDKNVLHSVWEEYTFVFLVLIKKPQNSV